MFILSRNFCCLAQFKNASEIYSVIYKSYTSLYSPLYCAFRYQKKHLYSINSKILPENAYLSTHRITLKWH